MARDGNDAGLVVHAERGELMSRACECRRGVRGTKEREHESERVCPGVLVLVRAEVAERARVASSREGLILLDDTHRITLSQISRVLSVLENSGGEPLVEADTLETHTSCSERTGSVELRDLEVVGWTDIGAVHQRLLE